MRPGGMLGDGVRKAPRSPGSRGRVWGGPPGSSDPARNDAPCPHDLVAVKPIWGPDFGFFPTRPPGRTGEGLRVLGTCLVPGGK